MRVDVNFNHAVDWAWFLWGLNDSLPEDAVIDFRYGNPTRHERFCSFILGLERDWTMETSLVGPGLPCLMAYAYRLTRYCQEIIAKFQGAAVDAGFIRWLGQVVKLANVGYNVRAEVPRPVNPAWLQRFSPLKHAALKVDVVSPAGEAAHPRGFARKGERGCDGQLALIWKDGKYYHCPWCLEGGLKGPVYSYGKFGEPFERRGKQECRLRYCPLE